MLGGVRESERWGGDEKSGGIVEGVLGGKPGVLEGVGYTPLEAVFDSLYF